MASKGGAVATDALAHTSAVQSTLKLAGYWTGPVDGKWTPELTDALEKFQTDLGVPATGAVDIATLSALEAEDRGGQGRGDHDDHLARDDGNEHGRRPPAAKVTMASFEAKPDLAAHRRRARRGDRGGRRRRERARSRRRQGPAEARDRGRVRRLGPVVGATVVGRARARPRARTRRAPARRVSRCSPSAVVIVVLVAVPGTRSYFDDSSVAADSTAQRVLQPLLFIPLGTVVFEEVIFRGVLLGCAARASRRVRTRSS